MEEVQEREEREEERRTSLDKEVKGAVGQSEKKEKWGVGIERLWEPSLAQKQCLKFLINNL